MKGFKYQITVTVLLSKYKGNGDIEYVSCLIQFCLFLIKSDKYGLDKYFQEILYRIYNWINEGSGWIIESIEAQYVNISIYSPLTGNTYIVLPNKLKKFSERLD